MTKVVTSKQFNLASRDFWKGALLAVLVPVLVIVQEALEAGEFNFDWKSIAKIAIGAFLAYLLKNFTDKPKTIIVANTNQEAEKNTNSLK